MQSTPFDLTGKVAVVTGSSRGIGRSSAELLAKLGAKVVISSRKAEACEAAAEAIRKAGGDAHVIPCNISREAEVEALIAGSIKHYGKVDILVCNAAINPYYGPLLDISDEAFDKIMGSNVKSNIWLCSLAIPPMAARGRRFDRDRLLDRGLARLARDRGLRDFQGGGLRAVQQPRRRMGSKGVRVDSVAPGLVKTDFARALWEDEERLKRRCATTPLRRIGEPDEIAGAIAYLRLGRIELHDRADHRGRRRGDHGGGVASPPLQCGAALASTPHRSAGPAGAVKVRPGCAQLPAHPSASNTSRSRATSPHSPPANRVRASQY